MVTRKTRVVIIGAGMAGLTAANHLYKSGKDWFELSVVEAGNRIGGRIKTTEFGGDRIEMGATWIHGIGGSPIHQIAQDMGALHSQQPWECMDNFSDEAVTIAEGGHKLNHSLVAPISNVFNYLMDLAANRSPEDGFRSKHFHKSSDGFVSIGAFLRQGLDWYRRNKEDGKEEEEVVEHLGTWGREALEEAIFAMEENVQRTHTGAGDLNTLDYAAECEYQLFPGEEISIAKGYSSIAESLASALPPGTIQLGRKVDKIEWQPEGHEAYGRCNRPVKLHFSDGSTVYADHVVVTVSLGVLKQGINQEPGMFRPQLPSFKTRAISRLGYGVVNKLFLQLSPSHDCRKFPFLQMVFRQSDTESKHNRIPWWMRKTATLSPIHRNSSVLLSWFAGEEALALESLSDQEIIQGVSETASNFLSDYQCNGTVNSSEISNGQREVIKFSNVLKSQWGTDPLFRGSYSYVAVGSSGEDFDRMAEPLPMISGAAGGAPPPPPLQILFAGEATHRTHYSTTHGAYFSGLREANRLLQHYKCGGL